ncbi:hypothetical protein [Vibrio cholerae]|uniref:hypothetical protein n=1 Tax=Vibrio cholerae TaxID=666 RepID=UPI000E0A88F7|nr:hypothetical protein [Vibrio cholerae]
MAWKSERWLNEVFPGEHELFSKYTDLTDRELAIVAAGTLDLALAELINKRLVNLPKESCAFLGLDESGSAPAGSMGARIQLALLLGIIRPEDARILRIIKNVRNKFAHRINVSFLDDSIQGLLSKLLNGWSERSRFLLRSQSEQAQCASEEGLKYLKGNLGKVPEAGEGLLLAVFSVYQAYFYRLSSRIERVGLVVGERA